MHNKIKYPVIIFIFFVTACGDVSIGWGRGVAEDKCAFLQDLLRYRLKVINNSGAGFKFAVSPRAYSVSGEPLFYFNNYDKEFSNIFNEGKSLNLTLIHRTGCGELAPPPANKLVYDVLFIRLVQNDQTHDYIAVGGSREDYEANIVTNDKYKAVVPAGAEILGYNFLYVPGSDLRKKLGLETPSTNHGYGIYSDIYPSRKTRDYKDSPTLQLIIIGTKPKDLIWTITE